MRLKTIAGTRAASQTGAER